MEDGRSPSRRGRALAGLSSAGRERGLEGRAPGAQALRAIAKNWPVFHVPAIDEASKAARVLANAEVMSRSRRTGHTRRSCIRPRALAETFAARCRENFGSDAVDLDEIVADQGARNAHALFKMIDGRAAEVEPPAAADIAAKREAARNAQQCSRLVDA